MATSLFKVNVSAIVPLSGKYLMVKRSLDEKVFPGYWGIPGGTLESYDKSLEEGLLREFLEEVGVHINVRNILSNNIVLQQENNVLYLVYLASLKDGEKPYPREDTEEVAWLSFEEISNLKLTPGVFDIIKLYEESSQK